MKMPMMMISTRGMTRATIVKFWKATPNFAPRRFSAVKKMIRRIAMILTVSSERPNTPLKPVTAAIARDAMDPEQVRIKQENPLIKPSAGW